MNRLPGVKTWASQTRPLLEQSNENLQATSTVKEIHHVPRTSNKPRSRLLQLCRALGIGLLYELIYLKRHPAQKISEPQKKAIRIDRRMAIFAGSIHFIPIAATVIICYLAWAGYYIGGELTGINNEDSEKFIGLLFAAKLHELTINASLTAVIFSLFDISWQSLAAYPLGLYLRDYNFKKSAFFGPWSFGALLARDS
ncbi:hypothetical protein ABVK25_010323 [Lepraria finkii]|uniref:Uncharacterized protein n=1 Tax=Lepraria finkii TaxID=1340010 RepID=A0ABR4AV41_9LECA